MLLLSWPPDSTSTLALRTVQSSPDDATMSHTGNLPTVWSEWELDPKHNRWKRYRLDANGKHSHNSRFG